MMRALLALINKQPECQWSAYYGQQLQRVQKRQRYGGETESRDSGVYRGRSIVPSFTQSSVESDTRKQYKNKDRYRQDKKNLY